MDLSKLQPPAGQVKKQQRVGRGMGTGRGKYSGRGAKGAKSISGYSKMRGFEGGQMPLHRRLPKRGFKNIFARTLNEVNLGRVQKAIEAGKLDPAATIDVEALVKAGVLRRAKHGVRLLGDGELTAKADFVVDGASKSAVEAVEKAGGSVKILTPRPQTDERAA
jgi:large subunit ribosomal protein L15